MAHLATFAVGFLSGALSVIALAVWYAQRTRRAERQWNGRS